MLKKRTKNKNSLLYIIVFLLYFICSINLCCYAATKVDGPGATIQSSINNTTEPETTHPKGFKLEGAEYYDYVGYDDQGRLVDKSNIIIGKGEGGSGQGGGSSGSGSKGVDSSGNGGSGISGFVAGQIPGQDGNSTFSGPSGGGYSRNIIGANGNQSSNTALKKQQAAEEVARQQSIEAELATAGAKEKEVLESIKKKALKESKEKESIRQSSMKAEALAKARAQTQQSSHGVVVKEKAIDETETIAYKLDEETVAPVNKTESVLPERQYTQSTTQKKPEFNNVGPTVLPETTKEEINTDLLEVPYNVPTATVVSEDKIEEDTVVETEVVTIEEMTTKNTTKQTMTDATDKDKKQEEAMGDLKKGDKGEKNHNDEDAEYKEELGTNANDGQGDGHGGSFSGVKIFEIERKGNIGITEKAGINNLEKLIAYIVVSLLLFIGIIYYYVPYVFKQKYIKSDFIS